MADDDTIAEITERYRVAVAGIERIEGALGDAIVMQGIDSVVLYVAEIRDHDGAVWAGDPAQARRMAVALLRAASRVEEARQLADDPLSGSQTPQDRTTHAGHAGVGRTDPSDQLGAVPDGTEAESTMADSGIRVVATDLLTAEAGAVTLRAGQYVVIAAEPCHISSEQIYGNGTRVITLRECSSVTPKIDTKMI